MIRITKANIQNQDGISMEIENRDTIPEAEIERENEEVRAKAEAEAGVDLIDLIVEGNLVAVAEVIGLEVAVGAAVTQDIAITPASIIDEEIEGVVAHEVMIDQDPMVDTLIKVPIS